MHAVLIELRRPVKHLDSTQVAEIYAAITSHPLLEGTIINIAPTTQAGFLIITTASTGALLDFMRWCMTNMPDFLSMVSLPFESAAPTVRMFADTHGDLVAAAQWFKRQPEVMCVQFATLDWQQSDVVNKDPHIFNLAVDLSLAHDQIPAFIQRMMGETDIQNCTVYRMSDKEVSA